MDSMGTPSTGENYSWFLEYQVGVGDVGKFRSVTEASKDADDDWHSCW